MIQYKYFHFLGKKKFDWGFSGLTNAIDAAACTCDHLVNESTYFLTNSLQVYTW